MSSIVSSPYAAPTSDEAGYLRRLQRPGGPVDVVLDTDAFNEIDDMYAIAYLLRSPERLRCQAIYAAPFSNRKAATPAIGMQKSHDEILRILSLMRMDDLAPIVMRGSEAYLADEATPVDSSAARDLAERAMAHTPEQPLYVVAIGAITNVASAILMRPEIVDRIVVVWLGGHAIDWPNNAEFNCRQDVAAARVVMDSGAALVLLPCKGVVSAFTTTGPELEHHLRGKNELCDYLVDVTEREAAETSGSPTWSRPIWDVTAVAWLLDGDFMQDRLIPCPIPEYDDRYAFDGTRRLIRYVYHIKRDNLFQDLFEKLSR
jgi:hypothetical protein